MRPELRDIQRLWCQHCKSMQKTNDTIVECWYNPLDEDMKLAFCAANEDACKSILALIPDIEEAKKQLIPDGWGNVGVDYRLYPGGVECVVTYITEAGFEESKGFAKAPKNKVENYDRQKLAKEALRQALQLEEG